MAHGLNSVLKRVGCGKGEGGKAGIGSRRIFAPHFKLQVLDSYRNDADCKGNQRATARKYGIHRRQIQKWLQVEGALRDSVVKSGGGCTETAPVPLDCSTSRTPDPAPMDLSLKTRAAPVPPSPPPMRVPSPLGLVATTTMQQQQQHRHHRHLHHPDVWDLSLKRPGEHDDDDDDQAPKPPPVKLFKPYLDDLDDAAPKTRSKPEPALCCAPAYDYYYTSNNNIVCDISYSGYEVQKTAPTFYYPYPAYGGGEAAAPGAYCYEDGAFAPGAAFKQRHSYSLDFKLSAIECYYQDSICKGNQRAVASKYNIHRRQVQKWLKQADELRQKNETIKQTQMVR